MKKIDITSTAVEKGLDLAKDFLEKLVYPSAEELGFLLKDGISSWRANRQIDLLNKTIEKCKLKGINPKVISVKLIYPLLDYASLEDNPILQEKWAQLLTNMVDSEQNLENHIFPYLLSQISIEEFLVLENTMINKIERVKKQKNELQEFISNNENIIDDLNNKIKQSEIQIERLNNVIKNNFEIKLEIRKYNNEKIENSRLLKQILNNQNKIESEMNKPEFIANKTLKNYEISNLIRLGLIKEIINSYGYVNDAQLTVINGHSHYESDNYVNVNDLSVTIENETINHELTELGELFIKACQEKK